MVKYLLKKESCSLVWLNIILLFNLLYSSPLKSDFSKTKQNEPKLNPTKTRENETLQQQATDIWGSSWFAQNQAFH